MNGLCVDVADMEAQLSEIMIAYEYRGPFWLKVSLAIDTTFFPPTHTKKQRLNHNVTDSTCLKHTGPEPNKGILHAGPEP